MYIVIALFAFIQFVCAFGLTHAKKQRLLMITLFLVGDVLSAIAGVWAWFEFNSLWVGVIFAITPILLAAALYELVRKRLSHIPKSI